MWPNILMKDKHDDLWKISNMHTRHTVLIHTACYMCLQLLHEVRGEYQSDPQRSPRSTRCFEVIWWHLNMNIEQIPESASSLIMRILCLHSTFYESTWFEKCGCKSHIFSKVFWQAEYLWFCLVYMFVCTSSPFFFQGGSPLWSPSLTSSSSSRFISLRWEGSCACICFHHLKDGFDSNTEIFWIRFNELNHLSSSLLL